MNTIHIFIFGAIFGYCLAIVTTPKPEPPKPTPPPFTIQEHQPQRGDWMWERKGPLDQPAFDKRK